MHGPETRQSLILSLQDPQRQEAWEEFVDIYQPLVYRLARQKGFQHADASDLCQEVLAAVGQSIDRFQPGPSRGTFRGWLFRIARNLIINVLNREKNPRGSGDTAVMQMLQQQADPSSDEATCFDIEYEREVFHWAADRVRQRVDESIWSAFWMTAVEGLTSDEVAQALDKTPGAVRVARCRVLGRIRREVQRFEIETTAFTEGK